MILNQLCVFSFLLLNTIVYSQSIYRQYKKETGLCTEKLFLYEDSTYVYLTSCDKKADISLGTWQADKKQIYLEPVNISTYVPVKEITQNETKDSDTLLSVYITDKYGHPIPYFDLVFIPEYISHNDIDMPGRYEMKQDTLPVQVETIQTNEDGKAHIAIQPNGIIKLIDIGQIFGRYPMINVNDISSDKLIVKLDLPKHIYDYTFISWMNLSSTIVKNSKKNLIFIE